MNCLVARSNGWLVAVPSTAVAEVLRPLPLQTLAGSPAAVSIIRGRPVPVVDLAELLGGSASEGRRLVVVRVGERTVALRVDDVVGLRALDLQELPPLFRRTAVEAIGVLDDQLLALLCTARVVPA